MLAKSRIASHYLMMESIFDGRIWEEDEADLPQVEDAEVREYLKKSLDEVNSAIKRAEAAASPSQDEVRELEARKSQILQGWWRHTRKT